MSEKPLWLAALHKIMTVARLWRRARLFALQFPHRLRPWLKMHLRKGGYRWISLDEARRFVTSDTLYILGSGFSISEITPAQWRKVERGNTLSFNHFVVENFVRVDFHLLAEVGYYHEDEVAPDLSKQHECFAGVINENPWYRHCKIVTQLEWRSYAPNSLIGRRLLADHFDFLRIKTVRGGQVPFPPTRGSEASLIKGPGSVISCIHFAYLLGWKNIVLLGIDGYDRRYFWQSHSCPTFPMDVIFDADPEISGRAPVDIPHRTIQNNLPAWIALWKQHMEKEGVRLFVQNRKSALAAILPIYDI